MNSKVKYCLLVEDDPEDQEFFIDALHSISSTTGCYAVLNGEEALLTLAQEQFTPDYIFTDINMPRMGGLEFLKTLKGIAKFRNIPVIIYSSEYSEAQIQKVKNLGALAIYRKTRFDTLKEILRRYFHDS